MKVLLAVDGSEYGTKAAKESVNLLRVESGSELVVLSVADDTQPMGVDHMGVATELYSSLREQIKEIANGVVEKTIEELASDVPEDVTVTPRVVLGSPKTKIAETAAEINADVVVMGSHGYGFLERMLLGSVSQSVLNNAPCPVLVVRH